MNSTEGYERLVNMRGKYILYRKLINGKGNWLAKDSETDEVFPITYHQALGYEPIRPTEIQKLSIQLGKMLLLNR